MKRKMRSMIKAVLLVLILVLLVSCSAPVNKPTVLPKGDYSVLNRYIGDVIKKEMNDSKIEGLCISVIDENNTIMSKGFGYQDKEKRIEADENTLFRLGSISKTVTGISIMQLKESGKVKLDSKIEEYIPTFKIKTTDFSKGGDITIKNIMTHHSGIPSDIFKDFYADLPLKRVIEQLSDEYKAYPSNYIMSYSNVAVSLLGLTIENVTGENFNDYTQENFFKKLDMPNSGFYVSKDHKKYSKGYDFDGKQSKYFSYRDTPAISMVSSAKEMTHYMKMLLNGGKYNGETIISKEALEEMWTCQNKDNVYDITEKTGLSWFIEDNKYFGKIVSHGGSTGDFLSMLLISPEHNIGVFVSANTMGASKSVRKIAAEAMETAIEIKNGKAITKDNEEKNLPKINFSKEEFKDFAGIYANDGFLKLNVSENNLNITLNNYFLDYTLRTDKKFHGEPIKIFGLIPTRADEMDRSKLEFKTIENEKFIIFENQLMKKVTLPPVSAIWNTRDGWYESDDKNFFLFLGFDELNVPFINVYAKYTDFFGSYYLNILNDKQASTFGLGRFLNEIVEFNEANGDTIIKYSGIRFNRYKK